MPLSTEQKGALSEIFARHPVAAAYLFGSTARQTDAPQSDVDIAVLFAEGAGLSSLERQSRLANQVEQALQREIDIVDLAETTSPLLRHRAVLRGELLYCSNDAARQRLECAVLHEYEDTRHLRAVQDRALARHIKDGSFGRPAL
ncbi:MAG: nucleotidyltransferase domain-containing protein [Candidatus Andersenbacteria bacterium CG10_big_fil_rev_8_21_14_0_10_54_11]|uniref:Nucleotidyltransferase domain-containing protein n=1 Tax=Candidatus Andersenbacteria bacterium CG10_big_fil_rev_8_21_14_0_10_54_11 TaxID=1974485 RepID=A0A2M6WZD4_9BACT|nr:MAG: nucleotidyltransferase domain-containing protein [Candidatus Andersenbacteria bacterium CG10_big_fil_rev_8_21_14_0_10_54_11]